MPGIFISYRRDSTAHAAIHLAEMLIKKFGVKRVFIDKNIEPGADFGEEIEKNLADAAALVVVIGRDWMCKDAQGHTRLEAPGDWVRKEVAAALKSKVKVIPVLLEDANMPAEQELPPELQPFARRQAIKISTAAYIVRDTEWELIPRLEKALMGAEAKRLAKEQSAARTGRERRATEERRAFEKAEAIRLAKEREEAARVARERQATEERRADIGANILLYVLMFGWLSFIAFSVVHHDFDWRSTESIIEWVSRRWYLHLVGSCSMVALIRIRARG